MLKFLTCSALAASAVILSAAPVLPTAWKAMGDAKLTKTEQSIRVESPGRLGGITGDIGNIANQRVTITAQVRGQGSVSCGIFGSFGWAYGINTKLSDEFKTFTVTYTEVKNQFSFSLFSMTSAATTFEVKDIKVTVEPAPELTDVEISAKLFMAADIPGKQGKVVATADAAGGKAVSGKRWYKIISVPVPANSRDLYYYCRLKKDSDKPMKIAAWYSSQNIAKNTIKSAPNQWEWVKIGPLKAAMIYPQADLVLDGAAQTTVWVDKVVLSTNPALDDAALNSAE